MGQNRYNKIVEIMKTWEIGTVVNIDTIKAKIIRQIGRDERTIRETLMNMAEMGMIKEVEPFKFEITKHD